MLAERLTVTYKHLKCTFSNVTFEKLQFGGTVSVCLLFG